MTQVSAKAEGSTGASHSKAPPRAAADAHANSAAPDADAFRASAPYTANEDEYEAMLYNYSTTRGRAFLRDHQASQSVLPTLLPKGIPYAANFVSFSELQQRGALASSRNDVVTIGSDDLALIYQAKCLDQELPPTWERQVRFMELVSSHCKSNFFCLPENGFKAASAEAIAHVLSTNRTYSVLDLSGNELRDDGAKHMAELLKMNRTIVHVDLSSNDIGFVGGEAVAYALQQSNTVVSLDLGARSGLSGNHIGCRGAEAIGKLLQTNQVLSRLVLNANGLGANGLSYIATGLVNNQTLTYLDISSNNLGYEGARILGSILEFAKLTHLHAQRNNLGDRGGKIIFQAISSAIETGADVLEHLDLDNNDLQVESCKAAKKVLQTSTALRTLRLTANPLGSGARFIAEGLAENKHLSVLHLEKCSVGEAEGQVLGHALLLNNTLTRLILGKNKVKDAGAAEIAKGLVTNTGLVTLDLSSGKIGDEGGKALASSLQSNGTLRELNLRRNVMTEVTGDTFNEMLRGNRSVQAMDVSYNDFSYQCLLGIKTSLERNAKLNKLHVVPKLQSEIDALAPKEKELAQVEEEVELEKRLIKDRTEQLLRRNEEARVVTERLKREVIELEKAAEKIRLGSEAAEDSYRQTEDVFTNETATLKMKKANMDTRVQQEKDKQDRMHRDIEKMRKQIQQIRDAEEQEMRPLLTEVKDTAADRDREMNDAKFEAEKLASLGLRLAELEAAANNAKKKKK